MAGSPQYIGAGARAATAGAVTLTPALAAGGVIAGLLLAVVATKNNDVHTCSTPGWSLLVPQVNSGAGFTASVWCAAGNAGAPTFNWTNSAAASAITWLYRSNYGAMFIGVGASASNNGTTSPHSTSSINTTQPNALVAYVDVSAANTALSTPSGYTANISTGSATDVGHTDVGSQAIATSGSPSTAISAAGAVAAWVQWQLELYIIPPSSAFEASEAELGAWVDQPGFNASEAEVGAWIDYNNRFESSEAELGAWLDFRGNTRRRQASIIN